MVLDGDAISVLGGAEQPRRLDGAAWASADLPHLLCSPSQAEPLRTSWTYAEAPATCTLAATGRPGLSRQSMPRFDD